MDKMLALRLLAMKAAKAWLVLPANNTSSPAVFTYPDQESCLAIVSETAFLHVIYTGIEGSVAMSFKGTWEKTCTLNISGYSDRMGFSLAEDFDFSWEDAMILVKVLDKVLTFKTDSDLLVEGDDIIVAGHCPNCGVEYRIHA